MSYDGRLLRLAQERYEADRSIREAEQAARREAIYTSRCGRSTRSCAAPPAGFWRRLCGGGRILCRRSSG